MKSTLLPICCLLALTIVSCEKNEVPGPAGPQGPTGPTGLTGPTGPAGGGGGGASMTFVQVQVPSSAWVAQGTYMYYADVSVPSVTQAIVDSGMVLVYFQESPFGWTPLPYNEIIAFNSYTFTNLNFYYTPGEVQFRIEGNVGGPANPGTMNFKVFTLAASGRLPDPSVLGLE